MPQNIKHDILEFIHDLDPEYHDINEHTDLIGTGVLDSLSLMELIEYVSSRFKVVLPANRLTPENLKNVMTLSALIEDAQHTSSGSTEAERPRTAG